MPDAFFQNNKNRKRKRSASGDRSGPSTSKKPTRAAGKSQSTRGKRPSAAPSKHNARDEELSDETNDEGGTDLDDMDLRAPDVDPNAYESAEEDEDETPAEKRLRLAKLYLEGVKEGLGLGAYLLIYKPCMNICVDCMLH